MVSSRKFLYSVILILPALVVYGCGGTRLDTKSIYAKSTEQVLIKEVVGPDGKVGTQVLDESELPQQSRSNVKVFTTIPEFSYYIIDTFHTAFYYEKDSVTYKKIENKNHLAELRTRAGNCGAKGIIVVYDSNEYHEGGETNFDMMETEGESSGGGISNTTKYRPGQVDVVHSDTMTRVNVKTYAIYFGP